MQFSDTASNTGLCQDIDFMCHTDTTSYPLKDKARNMNTWYRKTVSWIREAPSGWQYDDSNLTDLPIYLTTLVTTSGSEQSDYELPSTAQKIERVEVLDNNNDYQLVKPMDKEQVTTEAMSEFRETPGIPRFYDLLGRSVILYPKPGASFTTTTSGLKLHVARDVDSFVATDTTQEPGFASNFHRILSLGASFDFEEDTVKKNFFLGQIRELKEELVEFYSTRNVEYKTVIEPHRFDYN